MLNLFRHMFWLPGLLLACGGGELVGTGGSGGSTTTTTTVGSGASGGQGGAGATGGAMCDGGGGAGDGGAAAECRELANQNVPLGFNAAPTPGTYPIVAVTPTSLEVAGETLTWVGADLTTRFLVGENVDIERVNGWDSVEGATHRLATLRGGGNGHLGFLPAPFGPLVTASASQCSFEVPSPCDPCKSDVVSVYGLTATMGDTTQSIPVGETESLGAWEVTNGESDQYSGLASSFGNCEGEDSFSIAIAILGPAAPH